jgi:hypothetical protein
MYLPFSCISTIVVPLSKIDVVSAPSSSHQVFRFVYILFQIRLIVQARQNRSSKAFWHGALFYLFRGTNSKTRTCFTSVLFMVVL